MLVLPEADPDCAAVTEVDAPELSAFKGPLKVVGRAVPFDRRSGCSSHHHTGCSAGQRKILHHLTRHLVLISVQGYKSLICHKLNYETEFSDGNSRSKF